MHLMWPNRRCGDRARDRVWELPRTPRRTDADSAVRRSGAGTGGHAWRFTLLETIVVLAIIALIATLTLPRITRVPKSLQIRRTVDQIQEAFDLASLRARATGRTVALTIDTQGGVMSLTDVPEAFADADTGQTQAAAAGEMQGLGTMPRMRLDGDGPKAPATGGGPQAAMWEGVRQVKLQAEVAWEFGVAEASPDEPCRYLFFPDGAASGAAFRVALGETKLSFHVSRLTGRLLRVAEP
jgi:type II secretory pathway pseudopilin PulG